MPVGRTLGAITQGWLPAVTRQGADDIGEQLGAAILDRSTPISGDGWVVTGRTHVASAGPDLDGPVANRVDDYELLVVTGPAGS